MEQNGGLTLSVLGATITATGSKDGFTALTDEEKAGYADILQYIDYISKLFKSDILKLHIEKLTVQAGETEISASGDIDIRTDGTLAGGTLTLGVGEKSLTLTLYYEKENGKNTLYLELGGVKLKASIEDIKTLIDKLKNKEPAAAHALRLAAIFAEKDLFGVNVENNVLALAVNGEKLMKLLGSDFKLDSIQLEVATDSLGLSVVAEKFTIDATLSAVGTDNFKGIADKEDYIDLVKYVDFAVELFRNKAYDLTISYAKNDLTIEGKVSFDTESKTAIAALNLGYKNANKHLDLIYKDGYLYLTLAREDGKADFKFKANTASAVALILGYLGVSGTDELSDITIPDDAFEGLFDDFNKLISLSEKEDVLTILVDGTQLLEKLKVSLGDFKLGDIGVQLERDSLALTILGANLSVSGRSDRLTITLDEADYTDLSTYVDSVVNIFKQDYIKLTVNYSDKDFVIAGDLFIDVKNIKNTQVRADITITKGETKISLGIVYDKDGYIYLNLDGAKIKAEAKAIIDLVKGLFSKNNSSSEPLGRRLSARTPLKAALTEDQKNKILGILETILSLNLDDYFELAEERKEGADSLTLTVKGTELLAKLLGKDIKLGNITVEVEQNGGLTLSVLGATITATGSKDGFTALTDEEKAGYTDVLQYVQWAKDIFSSEAKAIGVSISAGDLKIDVSLDVIKGNAFMKGEITLNYRSVEEKTFSFIYEKKEGEEGNTEGWLYLDLDGVKIKAKTENILNLLKSLFQKVTGKEAGKSETIALGYAVAVISEAETLSFESFDTFSLTEEGGVLTLTLSGEKLMDLLGEKVKSLLGEKFSLESVGLSISQNVFSVSADASASGKDIALEVSLSKSDKTALTDEDTKDLPTYIDVLKYGEMVKDILASNSLQADIRATIGGKPLTLSLKFKKDFTMAQGTLIYGSLNLDLIYVLEEHQTEGAETSTKDVLIYVKVGENVKLMANVSEVIRIIKDEKTKKEARGRIAPIALSDADMDTLERLLSLDFGKVFELKEELAAAVDESDSLTVTIATAELLDALGVNFNLGTVEVKIAEGELQIALPDKAGLHIDLYGTTRAPQLEKPAEGDYHDITPIVKRVVDLIEAQEIEFSGDLTIGELKLAIEQGVFSWKEENKKFYLKASLGDIHLELLIIGEKAKLKVGSFGVEFAFSDIGDLIEAVKGLIARVKATIADIKKNITGTFSRDDLVGSLQGIVDVLNDLIGFLGGSKDAAAAAVSAKEVLNMGGMQLVSSALTPDENARTKLFGFSLGKLTIELFDETKFEDRGLLGLGLTVGDETKTTLSATVNTAVFTGDFPEIAGDFYNLRDFIDMLGYAGDAVALMSASNLTATIGGSVTSTNTAMYTTEGNEGLVYDISGNMQYASGGSFPIKLDMDENVIEVNTDFFLHFNLYIKAGTQQTMVNGSPVDTTPKNLYIDIFITDCDLERATDGELDFFVSVSQIGEGNEGYNPLKLYAPAKEILTILSGVASILGMDAVTYVNQYLIQPLLDEDMVARLKGLGVSLVPTILDMLLKDTDETESSATIANNVVIPEDAFGVQFGNVKLQFKSEKDGDTSYLTLLGITTEEEEKSGDATYTKTSDLAFEFSRVGSAEKKPTDLTGFFDIEGVDELVLALARTATHKATFDEVTQGIAGSTDEYVRNDLFYIDGSLHLDLSLIGIELEAININVVGLTVNFDANNQISLNAKLSYPGVRNVLAGLAGSSVIIKGDTVLDLTIKDGMMYLRRTQSTYFDGSTSKDLIPKEVIYRAMPLANFAKDTTTMMNNICFMFNLSEELISTIMGSIGGGTGGGTAASSDLGDLLSKYIKSATYKPSETAEGDLLYELILNGAGLTNSDSFEDITVNLGVEKGVLRSINIPNFSIASVVNINADLRLRNPEYKFDEGCYDKTESIADILEQAMANKLKVVDWLETTYLEGQLATVVYSLGGKEVGKQQIVFDPTTKELYANFSYPSIKNFLEKNPELALDGYTYEWEPFDTSAFKSEMTIYARPKANVYDLTFIIKPEDVEAYGVTPEQLAAAGYSWDASQNAYTKLFHWTYDSENYIDLPYITTKVGKIIGFRCPNEKLHNESHRGLDFYNQPTVEYRAEWEYIDYTVTFDLGNGQSAVKKPGHFGGKVEYPVDPIREGYTFKGWDIPAVEGSHTIAGNVTIHAIWEPNTYHITLVSDQPIDGFALIDGHYEKVIEYVYDSDTSLPANVETEGYILNGWSLSKEDTSTHYTKVPLTSDDLTLYAVWKLRGVDVRFVVKAEDSESGKDIVVEIKDFTPGDKLSNLPKVPNRDGYTGVWDFSEDYTVPFGGDTIYAKYTGITYYIHEYSLKRIDGFEEVKGNFDSEGIQGTSYWRKTYAYVYGGTPHPLTLGASEDVRGFDFDAYYTERFGQGIKIDPAVINDWLISKIFKFRVGDSKDFYEQNVLFANWIDNSVEVHLYSDYDFTGRMGVDIDGYYKSVKKMEGDYDITEETLTLTERSDLRRLGWWYQDNAGNWTAITNVERFRNTDLKTQATVKIFAMWIEDIDIKITSFHTNNMLGGAQYNIGGTLTGGLPSGSKSGDIYDAVKMTPTTTGYYVLFNRDGSTSDTPGGQQNITVTRDPITNVGSFSQTGMNSGTFGAFVWTERATYGGVVMRMEFKYGSDSIVFYGGDVVSMATYTVTYHHEGGEVVKAVSDVRTGYNGRYDMSAFSDWGITVADLKFDNTVYADELAAENKIACPQDGSRQNEGKYEWPHRAITGNADIYPAFVLDPVPVTFTSNFKFSDAWKASADGKSFTYTTKMRPYSTIEFIANGVVFKSYTVEEGKQLQTFAVPTDLPKAAEVRNGYWTEESALIGEYGATFIVQYKPDTIIYYSELGFTITVEDAVYGFDAKMEYSFEYSSEHTLIVPDGSATTVNGVTYKFLGWYAKDADGKWEKLPDKLQITASEEPIRAHAMWLSELKVSISSASRKFDWGYKYNARVEILSGGELIGEPKESNLISIYMTFTYYVNNDGKQGGTGNGTKVNEHNERATTDALSNQGWDRKSYLCCDVNIQYKWNGTLIGETTGFATHGV